MKRTPESPSPGGHPGAMPTLFAGCFGLLLGVGLLKFGNPVILDRLIEWPSGIDEWRAFAWPLRIGQLGLLGVGALGVAALGRAWRFRAPAGLLGLLAFWLGWQCVAAAGTVDPSATRAVLFHFVGCAACFLLGNSVLSQVREPRVFWICLVAGFLGVLAMAFDQRFGGLEATRKMILESPQGVTLSPEYLARIQSNRVFSTLVYPNALAGAVLLLLPVSCVLVHGAAAARWGARASGVAAALLAGAGGAVLVWSGSKAGWLLTMGVGLFVLFHLPLSRRIQLLLAGVVLVAGLTGFGVVFRQKLSRGATSVAARFDYWSAALQGVRERPWTGHGPGGFKRVYTRVKAPESEMAQLAHNDYLQQAVDSGFPGFLAYSGFILGSMGLLYRNRRLMDGAVPIAVWLGLAGWFGQGLVEFGLYIPATSWCAFALLGWLLAQKPSPVPG